MAIFGRFAFFVAAYLLACGFSYAGTSHAPRLSAKLHLTHVSKDKWRADYLFSEPVNAIDLGLAVGAFRKTAWHVITPNASLVQKDDNEFISFSGKPLTALSVEIDLYLPFEPKNYTQFDRFSDGGTDVYMGFFGETVKQGETSHQLQLRYQLTGLPGEFVLTPDDSNPDQPSYAYFGPTKQVRLGIAEQLVDPAVPEWLANVLRDTTAKIANTYDQMFDRKLSYAPLLMVSFSNPQRAGLSVKGGVVAGQVVYRIEGGDALKDTPKTRAMFSQLVSHEIAHVWQNDVKQGGVGEGQPWIHEGGAEAISIEGMRRSGLFTPEQADAYVTSALQECAKLQGSVETYRGIYACGLKRFYDLHVDIARLWKSMMEETERTGKPYSAEMVDALRARSG